MRAKIEAHDIGKMAMLLAVMVAAIVMGVLENEYSMAKLVLPAVLGYLTGNGVNALRGEKPSPVIRPTTTHDPEDDQAPAPYVGS